MRSTCPKAGKVPYTLWILSNIDNMNWRDLDGTRPAPKFIGNFPVQMKCETKAQRVWVASPDSNFGLPRELEFTQTGDELSFTIPSLKYWNMIVIE